MRKLLGVAALIAIGLAGPAWADDDDHDHGDHHAGHHGHGSHERVAFRAHDRVVVRHYMVEDYHEHCPPGLAKKHNGCMPPGQAKRRYVIGEPLLVEYEPVPEPLLVQLEPVPVGYQYVMVDRDVLLMSEATHHIVDAITLMSAVGH